MSVTHEQDVVRAREKTADLKKSYMNSIRAFIESKSKQDPEAKSLFLDLQRNGNSYFNYVENFVGDSDLLGAHQNGRWVIGLAEDCAAVLESLVGHIQLLREFAKQETPELLESIEPNKTAYANMQRMVQTYLTKERISQVRSKLESADLPVYGFDNHRLPIMNKNTQIVLSFVFGVVFISVMLLIAFLEPNPSSFQYTIFRIVMALAAGGVVATFPGFIEVKFGKWLRAGGALAVFSVVYTINPASLDDSDLKESANKEKLELGIDTSFMHEHTYAYSVMRPKNSPPRIHQLATWQRIILNNQSNEPINITELNLIVNNKKTAGDKLEGAFFEAVHLGSDSIKFSGSIQYPIHLEPKEFKYIFASLPIEVPQEIGELTLNILHKKSSKKDSMIELFLFGKEPETVFRKFMPTTINGGEELLADGDKISKLISYSDLALHRQIGYSKDMGYFSQVGIGEYDDGFSMMRTLKLFNLAGDALAKENSSIATIVSPVNRAILSAKTSLNEVFSIDLKPSSMLIKYTKA